MVLEEAPSMPFKVDKALQNKRMLQWMRITLANLRVYVTYWACGMGEIERPAEFQGQQGPT